MDFVRINAEVKRLIYKGITTRFIGIAEKAVPVQIEGYNEHAKNTAYQKKRHKVSWIPPN
jgi:hypothetical protein